MATTPKATVIDQAAEAIAALDLDYQKRRDALTATIKEVEDAIAENARLAVAQEEDAERVAARVAAQDALARVLENGLLPHAETPLEDLPDWCRVISTAYDQLARMPARSSQWGDGHCTQHRQTGRGTSSGVCKHGGARCLDHGTDPGVLTGKGRP